MLEGIIEIGNSNHVPDNSRVHSEDTTINRNRYILLFIIAAIIIVGIVYVASEMDFEKKTDDSNADQ